MTAPGLSMKYQKILKYKKKFINIKNLVAIISFSFEFFIDCAKLVHFPQLICPQSFVEDCRGVAKITANMWNEGLSNNSYLLKAVSYCRNAFCLRCLRGPCNVSSQQFICPKILEMHLLRHWTECQEIFPKYILDNLLSLIMSLLSLYFLSFFT